MRGVGDGRARAASIATSRCVHASTRTATRDRHAQALAGLAAITRMLRCARAETTGAPSAHVRHAISAAAAHAHPLCKSRCLCASHKPVCAKLRELFRASRAIAGTCARVSRIRKRRTRGVSTAGSIAARSWMRASVVFVFQQFRVGIRIQQLVELLGVVDHHCEKPTVAVGVLVDGLRLVGQRGVDLHHRAADRRVDV